MTEFLEIPKWEEYQHYKNRKPAWIKLHVSLLSDYDYSRLNDASKVLLITMWLLAAKTNNAIPNDTKWIAEEAHISKNVDLTQLLEHGFVVLRPDASNTLHTDASNVLAQEERKQENKQEDLKSFSDFLFRVGHAWNGQASCLGLPKMKKWTVSRKKAIKARMADDDWMDGWLDALKEIPKSPFLLGTNDRNWKANPDWFLRPDTVTKLLEGSYGTDGSNQTPEERMRELGLD